jgi:hypothetical protein
MCNELSLRDIFHRIVGIGESADTLSRQFPGTNFAMKTRDLAYQIEHSIKALSIATLQHIQGADDSREA